MQIVQNRHKHMLMHNAIASHRVAPVLLRKIEYACDGWTKQTQESMNTATGFGPTLIAEWSQADTDCAKHLTNVGCK